MADGAVELGTRDDAALVARADEGDRAAFAVLTHRHAPAVYASVVGDRDPTGATIATFVRAMKRLDAPDAQTDARGWLLDLAAAESRAAAPVTDAPPLDADTIDEIWAELDLRWPDGRVPRSLPGWLPWLLLVVVLLALAVLVPYLLLRDTDGVPDAARERLLAVPYDDPDREVEVEEAPDLTAEFDVEEPTFEFEPAPAPEADPEPAAQPEPEPEPEPEPQPPPPPPPAPAPEPDPEPEPEPEPEPDPEPEPEPDPEPDPDPAPDPDPDPGDGDA